MKNLRTSIIAVRLVVALGVTGLWSGAAYASDLDRAQVPFQFMVGKTEMPAGEYTLKIDWLDHIVIVHDVKTGENAATRFICPLPDSPRTESADGRLVFRKPANGDFSLSEVWVPGVGGVLVRDIKPPQESSSIALMR